MNYKRCQSQPLLQHCIHVLAYIAYFVYFIFMEKLDYLVLGKRNYLSSTQRDTFMRTQESMRAVF